MRYKIFISGILAAIMLLTLLLPACTPPEPADGYAVVVPEVFQAGSKQAVSVALFKGDRTIPGEVEFTIFDDDEEILTVKEDINGKGTVEIEIPEIEEGAYEVQVKGTGFEDKAPVRVERSFLVFQ